MEIYFLILYVFVFAEKRKPYQKIRLPEIFYDFY